MTMARRIFFYVQHLLGIGHLRRAAALSRALAASGFDVLLVSGGSPVEGIAAGLAKVGARFHQLPSLRAQDESLRDLCQPDGTPLDDAFRGRRTSQLIQLLQAEGPDVIVTEQFPFGRTRLRFELLPMLEAAKVLPRRPVVLSSIRDVLRDTVRPERVAETLETFDTYFDGLLIHADPRIVNLEMSFPGWAHVKDRAHYTGYVVDGSLAAGIPGRQGKDEVIVSAGGGAVGGPLLRAALAARPLSGLAGRTWRLLVGASLGAEEQSALQRQAGDGVIVEPARADFTTLLSNAALSISQAGYNTVVETLACAERAVLVPFGSERETEQTRRAENLADRGMVQMVAPRALSGAALAAAVDRALAGPSLRSFPACNVDGGRTTAALLRAMA
jgi:predicted glycosyltransferase